MTDLNIFDLVNKTDVINSVLPCFKRLLKCLAVMEEVKNK